MDSPVSHDPIARACEIGATTGPHWARRLVSKATRKPALRRTIAADLESKIMERGRKYPRNGWSKGMALEWSAAVLAGADPNIQAPFAEWEADLA